MSVQNEYKDKPDRHPREVAGTRANQRLAGLVREMKQWHDTGSAHNMEQRLNVAEALLIALAERYLEDQPDFLK